MYSAVVLSLFRASGDAILGTQRYLDDATRRDNIRDNIRDYPRTLHKHFEQALYKSTLHKHKQQQQEQQKQEQKEQKQHQQQQQ